MWANGLGEMHTQMFGCRHIPQISGKKPWTEGIYGRTHSELNRRSSSEWNKAWTLWHQWWRVFFHLRSLNNKQIKSFQSPISEAINGPLIWWFKRQTSLLLHKWEIASLPTELIHSYFELSIKSQENTSPRRSHLHWAYIIMPACLPEFASQISCCKTSVSVYLLSNP